MQKAVPLHAAAELGVQAVEKPKKNHKFVKIEPRKQGVLYGKIYPL